ncbi:unnamed protein product [Phyllotreta striolata]|uniref:LanC-like protein 3 homolog n=1 Tax=Phyllotreta striolata TaxID=444603 RepID=A0A9N9XN81_PHYSR|nr:unnamed protein product [Phyllotreta striolata]
MLKDYSSFTGRFRRIFGSMATARSRYFPNPKADYKGGSAPDIPTPQILEKLNDLLLRIENGYKPIDKNAGDGLYLGTAGVAYMYYHLSRTSRLKPNAGKYLNKAVQYLRPALTAVGNVTTDSKEAPSFILGNCGVYAVAACIYKCIGQEPQSNRYIQLYYDCAETVKQPKFLAAGSDELFVGRAGYVLGALWMAKETETLLRTSDIYEICDVIVHSGRCYALQQKSKSPLMYAYYQVEYLGAAHGLSSILQVLITVPGYLDSHPQEAKSIKESIDYLLNLQDEQGNFPSATDEIGYQSKLVHWCHGAGGIIYLMAKAYMTFKEEKYLNSCLKMADLIWEKGLLKKGPGLCHGVAGNGYAFLLLFRMTKDPKHLHRALEFYSFMNTGEFQMGARTPDYPYSLFEGLAGTACFLADLTQPAHAKFPFNDVLCVY